MHLTLIRLRTACAGFLCTFLSRLPIVRLSLGVNRFVKHCYYEFELYLLAITNDFPLLMRPFSPSFSNYFIFFTACFCEVIFTPFANDAIVFLCLLLLLRLFYKLTTCFQEFYVPRILSAFAYSTINVIYNL